MDPGRITEGHPGRDVADDGVHASREGLDHAETVKLWNGFDRPLPTQVGHQDVGVAEMLGEPTFHR